MRKLIQILYNKIKHLDQAFNFSKRANFFCYNQIKHEKENESDVEISILGDPKNENAQQKKKAERVFTFIE